MVRSPLDVRRGKQFDTSTLIIDTMGTLLEFCACVPRSPCHPEIGMLNVHTKQPNLTVNGVTINVPSITNAVASIVSAAQRGENFSVCTLNLDHVVKLQQRPDFRAAYHRAKFVTADGFPIVILSRLLGTRIERTTGADLVEPLCREAGKNRLPIFLLGSDDHTLGQTLQGAEGRRLLCARLQFRSLFQGRGHRDRQHPRFRRKIVLHRPRRSASGTFRSALP